MVHFGGRLEIGLRGALHVRVERLTARADACRLVYVSDLHLRRGRSVLLSRRVVEAVGGCGARAVLLGGDLVDGASELGALSALVSELGAVGPVLAVGGNHDRRVGLDRVRAAVEDGGGVWIQDTTYRLSHGSRLVSIAGPGAAVPGGGDVRVLCAHHPRVWHWARRAGYDLVLAGHLHGCQVVAFAYRGRLFPGGILYSNCCESRQVGCSRLVVSRGVSDLVPIRWCCPREVVVCDV